MGHKSAERPNWSSMANTIPPTKRGEGRRQPNSIGAGAGANNRNQPTTEEQRLAIMTSKPPAHHETDLLGRDNVRGIHGAARARKGLKHATSACRRRNDLEVIAAEVEEMESEETEQ